MDLSSAGAQRILSLLLDVSMQSAAFLFRRSLFTPVIKAVRFIKAEDTGASCPQAAAGRKCKRDEFFSSRVSEVSRCESSRCRPCSLPGDLSLAVGAPLKAEVSLVVIYPSLCFCSLFAFLICP